MRNNPACPETNCLTTFDPWRSLSIFCKPAITFNIFGYIRVSSFFMKIGPRSLASAWPKFAGRSPGGHSRSSIRVTSIPSCCAARTPLTATSTAWRIIYAEMLTGLHPWRNRPAVSGAADPDLGMLAKKDQAIVQRALSPNPRRRFSSMTEMMAALGEASDVFRPPLKHLLVPSDLEQAPPASVLACTTLDHFVRQLVYMVDCRPESAEEMRIRFAIEPPLPLASFPKPNEAEVHGQAAPFRLLDEFCQKWHAKAVHYKDGLTLVAINSAPSLWQRLRGQRHGLEIRVQFLPVGSGYERSEVSVVVKPFGCDRASAAHLLEALGPQLLDSVRACLHARPEQRGRERFAVRQRLQIRPVVHGAPAPAIECVSKDISAGGICFLVPGELAASEVYVSVPAHASWPPTPPWLTSYANNPRRQAGSKWGRHFPRPC